jgi:hypothetical protein
VGTSSSLNDPERRMTSSTMAITTTSACYNYTRQYISKCNLNTVT